MKHLKLMGPLLLIAGLLSLYSCSKEEATVATAEDTAAAEQATETAAEEASESAEAAASEETLEVVEESAGVLASTQPDPEGLSAGTELGRAIRGCLEGLVAPRRQAVSLWLLGYGHQEIAERLGWNRKRAENLVTRGRENLRECLAEKGYRS